MSADFQIGQGDTAPALTAQLTQNGTPVNLTGATVEFRMAPHGTKTTTVDGTATLTDATNGKVSYPWKASDTATPGDYDFMFVVTFSDGSKESFPNGSTKPSLNISEGVGE